jgi:hypothetical protein
MPVIKDCKAHVDVPKWRIGGYDHDICNFHQGTELWIVTSAIAVLLLALRHDAERGVGHPNRGAVQP